MNQLQQSLVEKKIEELNYLYDEHLQYESNTPMMKAVSNALAKERKEFMYFLSNLQKLEGIETEEYHSGKGVRAEHIRTGLFACEHASGDKNEEVAVSELLKLLDETTASDEMKSDFRGSNLLYP